MEAREEIEAVVAHHKLTILGLAAAIHPREIRYEAAVTVLKLLMDVLNFMMRIEPHLPLFCHLLGVLCAVVINVLVHSRRHAVKFGIQFLKATKHLVEGMVFESENNNVFDWIFGHCDR